MKKYPVLILFACIHWISVQAQDDKIATDRPSETQTPELVTRGYLQAEVGLGKEAKGHDYTLFHPLTTIRYGLSKKLELRAEIDGDSEKSYSKGEFKYGLLPVQFGFKAALLEAHGALPKTSFFAMAGIPTWASPDNKTAHLFPQLRLLMEHKMGGRFELDYNFGAEWQGEETAPQWLFCIEPQYSLGRKWQVFTEAYSRLQKGHGPEHVVDAGVAYFLSKNVKWDFIAGKGLSHEAPEYFIATGISFRFRM